MSSDAPSTIHDALRAARLGFGAAPIGNLGKQVSDDEAHAAVVAALEAGIVYFDTAPHYGLGLSEKRLGEALAGRPRESYLLSTKVGRLIRENPAPQGQDTEGFAVPDTLHRVRDYSRDGVLRSIEESLERLGTDRLDIVFIHDPDDYWEDALHGAVPALSQLQSEGVIAGYGAGMNQAEMLERFVRESDMSVVMLAGRYTLLEQASAYPLLDAAQERGVSIIDVGVYNSGLLSKPRPPADATYNYEQAPQELLDRANALADLAEKHGTDLPTTALHFPLRHPAVAAIAVGMRQARHVEQAVEGLERPVPESFWAEAQDLGFIRKEQ
jgi:D-threo-aldose 1-dehydrogenase